MGSIQTGAPGGQNLVTVLQCLLHFLWQRAVRSDGDHIFISLSADYFQAQVSLLQIGLFNGLDKQVVTLVADLQHNLIQCILGKLHWRVFLIQVQVQGSGLNHIAHLIAVGLSAHQRMEQASRIQRPVHEEGSEEPLLQLPLVI